MAEGGSVVKRGPDRRDSAQYHDIAKDAAREAVAEVFKKLGVDPDNVQEVRTFQANNAWVYRSRKLSEKIGQAVLVVTFITITGGILTAVWQALKAVGKGN